MLSLTDISGRVDTSPKALNRCIDLNIELEKTDLQLRNRFM